MTTLEQPRRILHADRIGNAPALVESTLSVGAHTDRTSSVTSGNLSGSRNISRNWSHVECAYNLQFQRGARHCCKRMSGGCHIYASSVGGSEDHITVDGVEPASYAQQGSSTSLVTTSGHYQLGTGQSNNDNLFLKGVIGYVVFFPSADTVSEMTQETNYIADQLSQRTNYPRVSSFEQCDHEPVDRGWRFPDRRIFWVVTMDRGTDV